MTLTPSVRKALLTTHVMSSVGWFGAVACFLVLAFVGVESTSAEMVRGSYLAMQVLTWTLIVPLCLASLMTGILQSLGTPWGLLRHYWVITKLVLTVVATVILLVHTQPIGAVATRAAAAALASSDLRGVRVQLVGDAGAALLVLFATTILSVYKPRGLTKYGWRRQQGARAPHEWIASSLLTVRSARHLPNSARIRERRSVPAGELVSLARSSWQRHR